MSKNGWEWVVFLEKWMGVGESGGEWLGAAESGWEWLVVQFGKAHTRMTAWLKNGIHPIDSKSE